MASEPAWDQAQGSIGQFVGGNADGLATDFAAEQHPEVERRADGRGTKRGNTGGPTTRGQEQRREGTGVR
jgi:hypothetical protein